MLVGQSTGLGAAKTVSGDITITNAGVVNTNIAANQVFIGNSGGVGVAQGVSLSNDVTGTMDSTGAIVTTIPSGTINRAKLLINEVTINITAGSDIATATVETGSIMAGWRISNAGAINGVTLFNTVEWADPTATVTINGTDGSQQTSFVLLFFRP